MSELEQEYGVTVPLCKSSLKVMKETHKSGQKETAAGYGTYVKAASKIALETKDIAKDKKHYYRVSIKSGATSVPSMFFCLVGSEGHSGKHYLDSRYQSQDGNPIDRDMLEKLVIESDVELGEIMTVIFGIEREAFPNYDGTLRVDQFATEIGFLCESIILLHQQQEQRVRVGASHTGHTGFHNELGLAFASHTALGASHTALGASHTALRASHTAFGASYTGDKSFTVGIVAALPFKEWFSLWKLINFTATALSNAIRMKFRQVQLNSMGDYEKMATILAEPKILVYNANRWKADVEFGRQILNGVNPVVIKRCNELPPNFPVTKEMVKDSLHSGKSLDEEMTEGHVYICDLNMMDGLPTREGQYCTAPMCLLYVNANKQLVPIAIQLKQKEGEDNPIFLPSDNDVDWLLAKIYYQSAHAQFHQISTHYYCCHVAMETYAVTTKKSLPDRHPIYKLLHPHFRYTMAINTAARATLINQGGIIDQLFAIGGEGVVKLLKEVPKHYRVHWTHIVKYAKERGVDDPEKLPGYYYRDDGIKIWGAIERFVGGIIDEFYKADKDVKEDPELQNWANDIHKKGLMHRFPSYGNDDNSHGFPSQIVTKEELTEYCTLIIFTGSAQHASVNFGQYHIYTFVPNAPTTLQLPPPSKKGDADDETLWNALPNEEDTVKQISISHLLSQYSSDEIYLGDYRSYSFTENKVHDLIKAFKRELDDIEEEIGCRNKNLDVPYTYMLPSGIPNSIAI